MAYGLSNALPAEVAYFDSPLSLISTAPVSFAPIVLLLLLFLLVGYAGGKESAGRVDDGNRKVDCHVGPTESLSSRDSSRNQ